MGLELACFLDGDYPVDFVEVQSVYQMHFDENVRRFESSAFAGVHRNRFRWIERNYADWRGPEVEGAYDLILCNPPYFEVTNGRVSAGDLKSRSRFFIDATADELWSCLERALAPDGEAFVLVRTDDDHGTSTLADLERRYRYSARVERFADVHGTSLLRLTKRI